MSRHRLLTRPSAAPTDGFQNAAFALERTHLRFGDDFDIALRSDAVDQIARHRRLKALAPHEQPDL
jgi:hypothetical protein